MMKRGEDVRHGPDFQISESEVETVKNTGSGLLLGIWVVDETDILDETTLGDCTLTVAEELGASNEARSEWEG